MLFCGRRDDTAAANTTRAHDTRECPEKCMWHGNRSRLGLYSTRTLPGTYTAVMVLVGGIYTMFAKRSPRRTRFRLIFNVRFVFANFRRRSYRGAIFRAGTSRASTSFILLCILLKKKKCHNK